MTECSFRSTVCLKCLKSHDSLTHCTSPVFSTFGSMRAVGSTSACRITSMSASARPLDTEFNRTHFSVRPRSRLASIFGMVFRASSCQKKKKKEISCAIVSKVLTSPQQIIQNEISQCRLDHKMNGNVYAQLGQYSVM